MVYWLEKVSFESQLWNFGPADLRHLALLWSPRAALWLILEFVLGSTRLEQVINTFVNYEEKYRTGKNSEVKLDDRLQKQK